MTRVGKIALLCSFVHGCAGSGGAALPSGVGSARTTPECEAEGGTAGAPAVCQGEDWWLPDTSWSTRGRIYVNGYPEVNPSAGDHLGDEDHEIAHGAMWRPYWQGLLELDYDADGDGVDDRTAAEAWAARTWDDSVPNQLLSDRETLCFYDQGTLDTSRRTFVASPSPPYYEYGTEVFGTCAGAGATCNLQYCKASGVDLIGDYLPPLEYILFTGSPNGSKAPAELAALGVPFMARRFFDWCVGTAWCGPYLATEADGSYTLEGAVLTLESGGTLPQSPSPIPEYLTDRTGTSAALDRSAAQEYLVDILHTYGPTFDFTDPTYAEEQAAMLLELARLGGHVGHARLDGTSTWGGPPVIGSVDVLGEGGWVPYLVDFGFLSQAAIDDAFTTTIDAAVAAAATATAETTGGFEVRTWNLPIAQGGPEFAAAVQAAGAAGLGLAQHGPLAPFAYDFMQYVPSIAYDPVYQAWRPSGLPRQFGQLHTDNEVLVHTSNTWGTYRWFRASALGTIASGFDSLTIPGRTVPSRGLWQSVNASRCAASPDEDGCLFDWSAIEAVGADDLYDWMRTMIGADLSDAPEAYCNLFSSGITVPEGEEGYFVRDPEAPIPDREHASGARGDATAPWQRTPRLSHFGFGCTLDLTQPDGDGAEVLRLDSDRLTDGSGVDSHYSGKEFTFGIQSGADEDPECVLDGTSYACASEGRSTFSGEYSGDASDRARLHFFLDEQMSSREPDTSDGDPQTQVWIVKVMFSAVSSDAASAGAFALDYASRAPGGCPSTATVTAEFDFDADPQQVSTATFRLVDAAFSSNSAGAPDLVLRHVSGDHAAFTTLRVIDGGTCTDDCPAGWSGATSPEACDGVDNDCDGVIDDVDLDSDGASACSDDCDDSDPDVITWYWYPDADLDGYGDGLYGEASCDPIDGSVLAVGDCDDSDAAVSPDGTEVCGGVDEDCDGLLDDGDPSVDLGTATTWYPDADGDGFGDDAGAVSACLPPAGFVAVGGDCLDSDATRTPEDADMDGISTCAGDCNDASPIVRPGAVDASCDGIDANCDGSDPGFRYPCYRDTDGDGWGVMPSVKTACRALVGAPRTCPAGLSSRQPDAFPMNPALH